MRLPQWRLASRLAQREVRRRPGRTLLVVFLIAIPVFGMTVGSVLVRTSHANAVPVTRWWRPSTDVVVEEPLDDAIDLSEIIPPDAEVSTIVRANSAPIVAADGTVVQGVAIEDPGTGMPSRSITITDGRLPRPGEVWVSGPDPELGKIRATPTSGEDVNQGLTRIFPSSSIDTDLPQLWGRGQGCWRR
jgi:hypothetical protein